MLTAPLKRGGLLYLEPFAGVSGDMFVGALLDLGVELAAIEDGLAKLGLGDIGLKAESCQRSGIRATRFSVMTAEGAGSAHAEEHGHHAHRTFRDIRGLIRASGLSEWVKVKSTEAFRRLAEAEGRIHSQPAEEVHFHEVGALDSIADIVGTMIAVEQLRPEHIACAPVNVGWGTLVCRHGRYPAPGPAVLELLRGVPVFSDSVEGEKTTPTGAALLTVLADRFDSRPLMRIHSVGYGAGSREIQGAANVFRITLGEAVRPFAGEAESGIVGVIEADIDDMTPEVGGHFIDRVLEEGALDVCVLPALMKKGRQGLRLSVVCNPEDLDRMAELVFSETTTIGIRHSLVGRKTLRRRHEEVHTEHGTVRIKIGELEGRRVNFAPEFDDCRRLAREKGVPLKTVMAAATASFLKR